MQLCQTSPALVDMNCNEILFHQFTVSINPIHDGGRKDPHKIFRCNFYKQRN